jgi:hypothetical protein
MKTKVVLYLFLALIAATAISCKKVSKTHPDFIGLWHTTSGSVNYTLDIQNNGQGRYEESTGLMSSSEWSGMARYKDGILKIGLKKLKINKEPYVLGQFYLMEMEGKTFTRY